MYDGGVHILDRDEVVAARTEYEQAGWVIYDVPDRIASKAAWFDATQALLPLNPNSPAQSDWDWWEDIVGGGIGTAGSDAAIL